MRETAVESALLAGARAHGGLAVKLAPTQRGVPDRLVLLPGLPALLVETKAPGGEPSDIQRLWHKRRGAIGHPVAVLSSVEEVRSWLAEVTSARV